MSVKAEQFSFRGFAVLVHRAIEVFSSILVKLEPFSRLNWLVDSFGTESVRSLDKPYPIVFVSGLAGGFKSFVIPHAGVDEARAKLRQATRQFAQTA